MAGLGTSSRSTIKTRFSIFKLSVWRLLSNFTQKSCISSIRDYAKLDTTLMTGKVKTLEKGCPKLFLQRTEIKSYLQAKAKHDIVLYIHY